MNHYLQSYDLVVIGESVGGIAASARAAREGLHTLLISYQQTLGGVFASLGAIETHYPGVRSPITNELKERIIAHYRKTYGADSAQYRACTRLEEDNPMITCEPKVILSILEQLVADEENLIVLRGYYPVSVELVKDRLRGVKLRAFGNDEILNIRADTFIDATYEGDLAAIAGVPYRIGREGREEYNEPLAGKVFTQWVSGKFPLAAAHGELNLIPKWTTQGMFAGSTGEGDDNIQSYSYRLCISCDPENRRLPEKPEGYDRNDYLAIIEPPEVKAKKRYALQHRFLTHTLHDMVARDHIFHGHALPNNKRSWNATNFPGAGKRYPEADLATRRQIARNHLNHALGIMCFLQNDPEMPDDIQQLAREWGLALDEFPENRNIPTHIYVREARRIWGRYTFTENDDRLAPGLRRAPIHEDSVAITEFPIDSLACTTERVPGSICDGQIFEMECSRPGQIPYRAILPERLQNLLVPVTASVTHIAWGTVRQTPTLIQLCEAAGWAAVLAKQQQTTPGELSLEILQRTLTEHGHMLSFFNEFDMAADKPWVSAVQYLGTKGLFNSYFARPEAPLTLEIAKIWAETTACWMRGNLDANAQARKLCRISSEGAEAITVKSFGDLLKHEIRKPDGEVSRVEQCIQNFRLPSTHPLRRGEACEFLYALTACLKTQRKR